MEMQDGDDGSPRHATTGTRSVNATVPWADRHFVEEHRPEVDCIVGQGTWAPSDTLATEP